MTMPGMFPSMGIWSQPATSSIREDGAHQAHHGDPNIYVGLGYRNDAFLLVT
jgi:hypothetical protein